ncbi:hypothetical protein N7495_009542 [Penicillium taxi]|uniref:uncharacterized protein n=1 Tax=Penicillium taxi TaxID=168475 RepID=UPI002545A13D|nr:uncharacterized protein N7495_009542 [Penicillium taxi]KAJ5885032.1 hypothetical protein N7495_009542 [Penicillium taxi]
MKTAKLEPLQWPGASTATFRYCFQTTHATVLRFYPNDAKQLWKLCKSYFETEEDSDNEVLEKAKSPPPDNRRSAAEEEVSPYKRAKAKQATLKQHHRSGEMHIYI